MRSVYERILIMKIELTLCQECLDNFLLNPQTIIHITNYRQITKDRCCFCQVRCGFDYVIEEKGGSGLKFINRTFDRKKCV